MKLSDGVSLPVLTEGSELSIAAAGGELLVSASAGAGLATGIPADSLTAFGPAIVSPGSSASLGLWLDELLRGDTQASHWTILAGDGVSFDVSSQGNRATVHCRAAARGTPASVFRHDARNLLNTIGINADLVGMHARSGAVPAVGDAATRIRSAAQSLATLVAEWSGSGDSEGSVRMSDVLPFVLSRLKFSVELQDTGTGQVVSAAHCDAVVRLVLEWAARVPGSGRTVSLGFGDGMLTLETHEIAAAAADEVFRPWYRGGAAPPELASLCPTESLRGRGSGFGSWQARGAAGICIGLGR